MKTFTFLSLLLASTLATGCAFENKLTGPTSPSGTGGRRWQHLYTGASSLDRIHDARRLPLSPARGARPLSRDFHSATVRT